MSDASGPIDDGVRDKVRSPAHGFCDDETTKKLLRTRPTRQALQWTKRHLGGRVVSTRSLRGGMSSAVHLVTVEHANGQRRQAVLRRRVDLRMQLVRVPTYQRNWPRRTDVRV